MAALLSAAPAQCSPTMYAVLLFQIRALLRPPFVVDVPGGLPANTGTFSNLLFDAIAVLEPSFTEEGFYNCCGGSDGATQLTITRTPEPSGFALLAIAMCMCGTFLPTARKNRFRQVS